jgi:tRNA1Val (adenine37-N6)-methyltransferase
MSHSEKVKKLKSQLYNLPLEKDIFHFKRFKIIQNSASVFKVNTEAVLLTAWADVENVKSILEIGCGTGIISIGLIQRLLAPCHIKAIDINPFATELTQKNIDLNAIKTIKVETIALQDLAASKSEKYDLIISNPPYFDTKYKSTKDRNQLAKYTDSLSFTELIQCSSMLLSENGSLSLIIPFQNTPKICELARLNGLILHKQCEVYTSHKKGALRSLLQFKFEKCNQLKYEQLFLVDESGNYTEEYKALTAEYYTIF